MFKKIIDNLKENWITYGFETLVVVIGILAAFALNNWNEYRIERTKEKELLIQIRENIIRNMTELNSDINGWDKSTARSLNLILRANNEPELYKDSLSNAFNHLHRVSDPAISYAAYEALKDNGLEIIQSPALRNEIVNLFDITFRGLEHQVDELELYLIKPTSSYFVYKNFYRNFPNQASTGRVTPNNYNEIISSTDLKNIASHNLGWTKWFIQLKEDCLEESTRVLKIIEQEIDD